MCVVSVLAAGYSPSPRLSNIHFCQIHDRNRPAEPLYCMEYFCLSESMMPSSS